MLSTCDKRARWRRQKRENAACSTAPVLQTIVIDTLGNEVVEPQPSIIKGTDYDDNGKEVIA